jgi:valyl-tRNA synthetase
VRYSEERVRQGRQLVTKLWNATRLVVDRGGAVGGGDPSLERLADRWIASRTAAAVAESEALMARYELSAGADLVYHLIFDDYCDWYLELLKAGEATPETAAAVLEQLLALAHPLMPFVTEECWSRLPGAEGLMLVHPPAEAPGPVDPEAEAEMAAVRADVTRVRAERAERGLPPRAPMLVGLPPDRSAEAVAAILALADPVTLGPPAEGAREPSAGGAEARRRKPPSGRAEEGVVTVVPADVDPAAERARLSQLLAHAEAERARAEGKLGNAGFVERAPADLVDAEREKVARHGAEAEALRARLAELERG